MIRASKPFVRILVDCTARGSHSVFKKRYHVRGYPTVLFLDSRGRRLGALTVRQPFDVLLQIEALQRIRASEGTAWAWLGEPHPQHIRQRALRMLHAELELARRNKRPGFGRLLGPYLSRDLARRPARELASWRDAKHPLLGLIRGSIERLDDKQPAVRARAERELLLLLWGLDLIAR